MVTINKIISNNFVAGARTEIIETDNLETIWIQKCFGYKDLVKKGVIVREMRGLRITKQQLQSQK